MFLSWRRIFSWACARVVLRGRPSASGGTRFAGYSKLVIRRLITVRFVLGARNGSPPPAVVDHHLSVRHAIYTLRHPVLPPVGFRLANKSGSVTWSTAIWPSSEISPRRRFQDRQPPGIQRG